jgi:uncharacterized protein YukE
MAKRTRIADMSDEQFDKWHQQLERESEELYDKVEAVKDRARSTAQRFAEAIKPRRP